MYFFFTKSDLFRLLNVVAAKNDKDIYLVFEYMDTDLHAVIRKGGILQVLVKTDISYIKLNLVATQMGDSTFR